MNVLYIDWKMFGKDDIITAFRKLGHKVDITDIPLKFDSNNEQMATKLEKKIIDGEYDIVFTSNYYPIVSNICDRQNVKYISWTYDSPLIALYDKSIANKCNYVFTFDSEECDRLKAKGVKKMYYMPLAANTDRLDLIGISKEDENIFSCDISLVASLYNESHNLYSRMEKNLNEFTKGYLRGIMNVQKNLFGAFVMEEALYNKDIMKDMYNAFSYEVSNGSYATKEYVYANYVLARKVAELQRLEYIAVLSSKYDMKVYTGGDLSAIKTVKHMGTVDYLTDMNKVFKLSKINLNITLPSIHTGIPLRVMDILANGGFLLTNYQQDMFELFEPGVDFVYYTSLAEAMSLAEYYLNHDDERKEIASNALEKMRKYHKFEDRIRDILDIVEENKDK